MVGVDMDKLEGRGGGMVSGHTPRAVEGGKGEQELIPVSTREGGLESQDPISMQRCGRGEGKTVTKWFGLHKLTYGGGAGASWNLRPEDGHCSMHALVSTHLSVDGGLGGSWGQG